jgi:N-6 DNA Methylase
VTLNEFPGTVIPEFDRGGIHDFTLKARYLLTEEIWTILEGVYGLRRSGGFEAGDRLRAFPGLPEVEETRDRLQRYLEDEVRAGLRIQEAVEKLVKEVAFTHLNRLVAFKMLEARKLIRGTVDKYHDSNAFKFYLVDHPDDMDRYEAGSMPQDSVGEGPRDVAYRHFLLWQCNQLAREINLLFDPTNLPSRLFPRPTALRQLIVMANAPELAGAWTVGNEETIGWVYQYFNEEEKAEVFNRLFKQKQKIRREDIPAATQLFTPNWIVRWIVHNTLGRMWVQMHADSSLAQSLDYLVPLAGDIPVEPLKPVREIQILDPACGTMHFGLVAFDLLAEMYEEEIEHAGEPGWPERPSVDRVEDIPASIIANNLFGIDIDLRAVQLSALTLYVKAKSYHKGAAISASNLACADVLPLNSDRLNAFIESMQFSRPIYERLIRGLWARLKDASLVGSLLRLEDEIQKLVEHERGRYQREAAGRLPFPELQAAFEGDAAEDAFWIILEEQIIQAFDEFARQQAAMGDDESYFAGEATKGMRLLDVMRRRYDVVVTNPPYLFDRNMNSELLSFLKSAYPTSTGDLYTAFIQRCSEFQNPRGRLGMITQQSFMFISSYERLRNHLLGREAIEGMCHLGTRAFDEIAGEKVNTVLFALRAEPNAATRASSLGTYFRFIKEPDAKAKKRALEQTLDRMRLKQPDQRVFSYQQDNFTAIAGSPWVYWITPSLRQIFESRPGLGQTSPPRQGLATAYNFRFLRYWWEVGSHNLKAGCPDAEEALASGRKWFPYMKGGGFRRWWGNQKQVINWALDGQELRTFAPAVIRNPAFYFRRGITYSYLTSATFSARLSPGGFIFDVAGSSLFPRDVPLVLAVLNSSFAAYALHLINPTVNFQVGDLARLPIPNTSSERLKALVDEAVDLARADGHELEVTYDFVIPPAVSGGLETVAARNVQLAELERQIDVEVYRLYGIGEQDRAAIVRELSEYRDDDMAEDDVEVPDSAVDVDATASIDRQKLAQWWISYAVGIVIGRFQIGVENGLGRGNFSQQVNEALSKLVSTEGIISLDVAIPGNAAYRVEQALDLMLDEAEARGVIEQATGGRSLVSYLERDFFKDHVQCYGKRPIYWLLQSPRRSYGVYVFHERITKDTLYIIQGNQYLGGKINQVQGRVEELHARAQGLPQGRGRKQVERELDDAQNLLTELESFARALKAVTSATNERGEEVGWNLEIDDGVLINLAPLQALMPAWSTEPKKAWESLRKGEWDWSHTAMRYWPDRVLEKCRTNKSYAIAHGRMDVYEGKE